tara:strand:+ start:61502 stop:63592 length:2091 start_codon:yes stop_codon:yes gene_type:complete
MKLIYEGSTKNIIENQGTYSFDFKDDYSVFDWGKMPDLLENKGFYLCQIGGVLFEYLSTKGIKHHMLSYFNHKMQIQHFELSQFINLEVIFRFGVPTGSSLIKSGYKEGEKFQTPLVEYTTKREAIDRKLTEKEAIQISGLNQQSFKNLHDKTIEIATILKEFFADLDIELWDGKFEFAQNKNGELILTDSIGLDELRLSYKGQYFSKELLRQYYRQTNFYKEIEAQKVELGRIEHSRVKNRPSNLAPNVKKHMEQMYEAIYRLIVQGNRDKLDTWNTQNALHQFNQKVIIYGEGGREHTIAQSIMHSPFVSDVFMHTKRHGLFEHIKDIYFEDDQDFIDFCHEQRIDLVIIGPEAPLCRGLADKLRENHINTLGAGLIASQLESSKIFTKNFLEKAKIKTAQSFSFDSFQSANSFLKQSLWPNFVIKVDGLAAGKGVAVCDSQEEALKELELFNNNYPKTRFLIEEKLNGREVSLFYLIDENKIKFIGDACDHKALLDGNLGPNTGGMGTYSPCDWLDQKRLSSIQSELSSKIMQTLKASDFNYNGILFVGLMVDEKDYNVLEFNIRLGDPETQVLLPRIKDDLFILFKQCALNLLTDAQISFSQKSYVHVVCSSKNYPYSASEPSKIKVNQLEHGSSLVWAGVKKEGNDIFAIGGRVCGVTACGESKIIARELAYKNINNVDFEGKYYRHDIAK